MKIEFSTHGFNKRIVEAKNFSKACNAASDYIFGTCGVCGYPQLAGLYCPACDKTYTEEEYQRIIKIRFAGIDIRYFQD